MTKTQAYESYKRYLSTLSLPPDEYKKNYVYLNEYTIYAVEDITGIHTDPYHYKMYFHTNILPDIEVRP